MLRKERRLKEEAAAAEVRLALEADGAISKEEGNSISNSISNSSSSSSSSSSNGTAAPFVASGSVVAPTDSAEVGQKVESNKLTMHQQSRIEDMKE